MKLRYELVKRVIAGETFLVPIGDAALRYSGLFALNEVGAFLWDALPEADDAAALVERILEEYDVSREQAEADTSAFLAKLREMEIIF